MNGEVLIGIDLGGTNCRAALVSLTGEILVLNKVPTKMHEGRDFFLARLFRLCDDLIQFAAREGLRVSALGMGPPASSAPPAPSPFPPTWRP